MLRAFNCNSLTYKEDDKSWEWSARKGICQIAGSNGHPGQEMVMTHRPRDTRCCSLCDHEAQLQGCAVRAHHLHGMAVRVKVCITGSGLRGNNTFTMKQSYRPGHSQLKSFPWLDGKLVTIHASSSEHIPLGPWVGMATYITHAPECQWRFLVISDTGNFWGWFGSPLQGVPEAPDDCSAVQTGDRLPHGATDVMQDVIASLHRHLHPCAALWWVQGPGCHS